MTTKAKEITLKGPFLKKLNAKPGDHFEIVVKDNGKITARKKTQSVTLKTFGIWKGEVDGVKFMDKMRKSWDRF